VSTQSTGATQNIRAVGAGYGAGQFEIGRRLSMTISDIRGDLAIGNAGFSRRVALTIHPLTGFRMMAVPAHFLSSLVFVLSEIVFGGCCYFQWILCFGQSFPQDLAAPAVF
jgi:hypothetical protein